MMIRRSRSSSRPSIPLTASCIRFWALSYSCSSIRLSAAASNISSWPVTNRSRRKFSSGIVRAKFFMIAHDA